MHPFTTSKPTAVSTDHISDVESSLRADQRVAHPSGRRRRCLSLPAQVRASHPLHVRPRGALCSPPLRHLCRGRALRAFSHLLLFLGKEGAHIMRAEML